MNDPDEPPDLVYVILAVILMFILAFLAALAESQ